MSVIYIKDLIVGGKHGVHAHEKTNPQRFRINLELTVDTEKPSKSDDIKDTVNWSHIRKTIIQTVEANSFNLMERLAREIAQQILKDKTIDELSLSIDKLDAFETGTPGIRITMVNK